MTARGNKKIDCVSSLVNLTAINNCNNEITVI